MEPITDAVKQFQMDKEQDIQAMTRDKNTKRIGRLFMDHVTDYKYGYYFTWMGRPIIQHPQDMVALQEIIMEVQPDLIIETGIGKFVMHQQKFLDSCVGIIPFSPGTICVRLIFKLYQRIINDQVGTCGDQRAVDFHLPQHMLFCMARVQEDYDLFMTRCNRPNLFRDSFICRRPLQHSDLSEHRVRFHRGAIMRADVDVNPYDLTPKFLYGHPNIQQLQHGCRKNQTATMGLGKRE